MQGYDLITLFLPTFIRTIILKVCRATFLEERVNTPEEERIFTTEYLNIF